MIPDVLENNIHSQGRVRGERMSLCEEALHHRCTRRREHVRPVVEILTLLNRITFI